MLTLLFSPSTYHRPATSNTTFYSVVLALEPAGYQDRVFAVTVWGVAGVEAEVLGVEIETSLGG